MRIETKFNLLDDVFIKDLNTRGKVRAIFIDQDEGIQYRVRWFNGHDPKSEYFYESEIDRWRDGSGIGFSKPTPDNDVAQT